MYLKINVSDEKREEVKEALRNIGVIFEEFDAPLKMFYQEEAEYRLDSFLDDENYIKELNLTKEELDSLKKGELRKEVVKYVSHEYSNDDYILNSDSLENISEEALENSLIRTYENNIYISKEEMHEIKTKLAVDDISKLESNYIDGVKIETDSMKSIQTVVFNRKSTNYRMELILCSGQTNYWLEIRLCDGYVIEKHTSEPFFDLDFEDELIMKNEYGSTFIAHIKDADEISK